MRLGAVLSAGLPAVANARGQDLGNKLRERLIIWVEGQIIRLCCVLLAALRVQPTLAHVTVMYNNPDKNTARCSSLHRWCSVDCCCVQIALWELCALERMNCSLFAGYGQLTMLDCRSD